MVDEANKPEGGSALAPFAAKPKPKLKILYKTKAAPEREQSTISFPYMDLDAAISVARAILDAGGVPLSRDQLAGTMKLVANSGNFVTKTATARLFGLISYNSGKYELTNLGFSIVDSDEKRVRAAKAEAFLNVPLYRRTYDEFKGKQLPPRPHGLEQAFVKFGVSSKQKTNARLAFDKSANQAGFFGGGTDRLIEPIIAPSPGPSRAPPVEETVEEETPRGRVQIGRTVLQSAEDSGGRHPFIQGLLDTLPEPHTNWKVEGRATWLQAAAKIFDLIYKGSGDITISAKASNEQESESAPEGQGEA